MRGNFKSPGTEHSGPPESRVYTGGKEPRLKLRPLRVTQVVLEGEPKDMRNFMKTSVLHEREEELFMREKKSKKRYSLRSRGKLIMPCSVWS